MAEPGITSTGFVRKRLDEILEDKNTAVQEVFGPDINLTPQSPDGQINGVLSESDAFLWELAQATYDAFNPDAAVGNILSNLVQLNGITRQEATPSTSLLDMTGVNSTVIPAGSIVATASGIQYATDEDVTISAGIAVVQASAVIPGATVTLQDTITTIVTPVSGWSTANNPADAVIGLDGETDSELRIRRAASVAFPSQSLLESIFSSIANLDGVDQAIVLENDTNSVDSNGQAPHSIQAIVSGGDNQEIAEAIFREKCTGITTEGTTTVSVTDVMEIDHDINFQRPLAKPIFIIINLTTNSSYPVDGADQIAQAIIEYAAGNLVEGTRIGIGDDVLHSRLFTPVNTIPGHTVDSMFIGFTGSPSLADDLAIAFNELAEFTSVNITVNT